jgi:glycosyltransferase involved in cell wall biosynthesis
MKVAIIRGAFANPYELQNYKSLKRKVDITIYTSHRPLSKNLPFKTIELSSPFDIPNFAYKTQILNRIYGDAHYLTNLENSIKGTDIAYVAETYYGYTQQAIEAKKKGYVKKVISLCWETIPHNNEGIRKRKEFKENSRDNIDIFVCPTEKAKQALIKEGVSKEKIIVIPLGIDIKRFKLNPKRTNKNILFVGRLEREKGVYELLECFNNLYRKHPNITLTIVGKGKEKVYIQRFIQQHHLTDSITLTESEYEDIAQFYYHADMFVLPSKPTKYWEEQYGMVLLEAMASGLPIAASSCGAIPEVLGDAAVFFKPGKTQDIENKLEKIMTDRTLRDQLAKKAYNRAHQRYDSATVAKHFEELFLR